MRITPKQYMQKINKLIKKKKDGYSCLRMITKFNSEPISSFRVSIQSFPSFLPPPPSLPPPCPSLPYTLPPYLLVIYPIVYFFW